LRILRPDDEERELSARGYSEAACATRKAAKIGVLSCRRTATTVTQIRAHELGVGRRVQFAAMATDLHSIPREVWRGFVESGGLERGRQSAAG
jgi:hypothetical protein